MELTPLTPLIAVLTIVLVTGAVTRTLLGARTAAARRRERLWQAQVGWAEVMDSRGTPDA